MVDFLNTDLTREADDFVSNARAICDQFGVPFLDNRNPHPLQPDLLRKRQLLDLSNIPFSLRVYGEPGVTTRSDDGGSVHAVKIDFPTDGDDGLTYPDFMSLLTDPSPEAMRLFLRCIHSAHIRTAWVINARTTNPKSYSSFSRGSTMLIKGVDIGGVRGGTLDTERLKPSGAVEEIKRGVLDLVNSLFDTYEEQLTPPLQETHL